MKRIVGLLLVVLMMIACVACGKGGETQLGTSKFTIVLPNGYEEKEDDYSEDQVAYYYKDDDSVDFDVYQWAKGDDYTLAGEAAYFAAQYNTTETQVKVNNIDGYKYISQEDYEGATYTVINYMFDDGTYIVEVSFWTDNSVKEITVVNDIIETLEYKE